MQQTKPEHIFAESFSVDFTKMIFPELWMDIRKDAAGCSRKDLAEDMFYAGAVNMLFWMQEAAEGMEEELEEQGGDDE